MTSLNEKLRAVQAALAELDIPTVRHYYRTDLQPPYLLWAESGEGESFWSCNAMSEQVVSGDVDYFTRTEFDPSVDAIQEALFSAARAWRLDSVDYEEGTNLIHYHWTFEVA